MIIGVLGLTALVAFNMDLFSIESIEGYAEFSIWLTALGFLLVYIIKAFSMAFPTGLLYIAAGIVFNPWIGLAITYGGLTIAIAVGYFMGRRLGQEQVDKMFARHKKAADLLNRGDDNLALLCFMARVLPLPFGMVSMFFGAVKMPFWKYLFVSLLGASPFMIPFVVAGSYIENPLSPAFITAMGISLAMTFGILIIYKTRIITRARITALLVLAQIAAVIIAVNQLHEYFPTFALASYALSILMVLVLVKRDKATGYKLIWIIIIMGIPMMGGILYVIFGNNRPTRRIAAHVKEHAIIAKLLDEDDMPSSYEQELGCDRMAGIMQYIRRTSSYHPYENTKAMYYPMGEDMFEDMLVELKKAERFIFLEYFIISKSYMWDSIKEILLEKAAQGVDVRLIFDDIGSLRLFTRQYVRELRKSGIKIIRFNPIVPFISPFMNNRNHRKILAIDGHIGFCGGMNIADEYINRVKRFGLWKDTGIKLTGEAAWSYTLMFIETWDTFCKSDERIDDYIAYKPITEVSHPPDGLIVPYGDTPLDSERLGENVYVDILNQAKEYCYIFTPYLIISEKMIYALQMAAKRGVDVCIITPCVPDKKIVHRLTRSYYRYLLQAGVRIYEYTPGFLHAKSFVCDDAIAVVGTINLDYRSLYLHFECATLLYKSSIIKDIKADADAVISVSQKIELSPNRHYHREFFDAILHLFAPLM